MNEDLRNPSLPPDPHRHCEDGQRLFRLAQEEARVNRAELEWLYERGTVLLDDQRYEYLWNLTQLERTCAALERTALNALREAHGLDELREGVSRLVLRAVELRQKARTIVNGEQHRAEGRATRLRRSERRPTGNSSQRRPALA